MSNLSIRLQQARKAAGLSLRSLAELVGLSHAAIKKYEDGKIYPSSEILIKLAKALNVKIDHFFRPVKVSLDNVKFRKRSRLTLRSEESIKFAVISQIEKRLELENLYPSCPIPSFTLPASFPKKINSLDEIEISAEQLRNHWKLGQAPIHDLIDSFEIHGVRVFIVETDEKNFDGLFTIINHQPFIVISAKWSGDRQRFSLAHELAHYIFSGRLADTINEEIACNRFAASFIFPKEAVYEALGKTRKTIELQELLILKEQFQLSISGIVRRLKDLGIIQESHYIDLNIRFRKKGWHRQEPGLIPSEKAHTFHQLLFHALAEEYIGEQKAAELLSCSLTQLKSLRKVQHLNVIAHNRC